MRIGVFIPCYVATLRPAEAGHVRRVLHALGDEVEMLPAGCCGQPAFNSGFQAEARSVGLEFLRQAREFDTVVIPSGSCTSMAQHYLPSLFEGAKAEGAKRIAGHTAEFASYVANHPNLGGLNLRMAGTVAYHDSCHARRELALTSTVVGLLGRVQGLEVRRLAFEAECCGFGGSFSVKLPEVSTAMLDSKLRDVAASGAGVLVSTDLSCLGQIEAGARGKGSPLETWSIAELLARALAEPLPLLDLDLDDGEGNGYRARSRREIARERPDEVVTPIMRKLVGDSAAMIARGPADARARAEAARAYSVANLEALHVQLQRSFAAQGIGYHRATTGDEAVAIIKRLLGDAKRVPKSKTMVGEEIGLTHALREAGIDVLETDIGEYIVDIEGRGPSHITAPALHLNRARIRELLQRTGTTFPDDDPTRLSRFVRDVVGDFFKECDAGITGANAVIASTGRLMVVENEGNVSLGVSHPRLHIAVTGIEKVVADEAAGLSILEVLAPSATAQPLTSFTHFLGAPDPGQQRHVVFVDNGRSRILADERYRDVLKCIRCGACMNGCPVYRAAGGLSYGSPYMGPIGAVLSPLLWDDGRHADLPFASSLCGRCTEACPVGIPLHRMLLDLRSDATAAGKAKPVERAIWKGWAATFRGATRARLAADAGRFALRVGGALALKRRAATDTRQLPALDQPRDPVRLVHPRKATDAGAPNIATWGDAPGDLAELFRQRAASLGVAVLSELPVAEPGDHVIAASAGIANTGSVVLTAGAAARRPILGATRVIVRLDAGTLVRHPHEVAPYLGTGDALILTGASRTADIEKIIVRGIHGSEELIVVLEHA